MSRTNYVNGTLDERFWAKVDRREDDECWPWIANRMPKGYGLIRVHTDGSWRNGYAHRVSYEMANGPIPDGLLICHRCDNPPCVNPAHLFAGTHVDNMRDCASKGRIRIGTAKLTRADADEIRASATGVRGQQVALAAEYGVSGALVSMILKRKIWV